MSGLHLQADELVRAPSGEEAQLRHGYILLPLFASTGSMTWSPLGPLLQVERVLHPSCSCG